MRFFLPFSIKPTLGRVQATMASRTLLTWDLSTRGDVGLLQRDANDEVLHLIVVQPAHHLIQPACAVGSVGHDVGSSVAQEDPSTLGVDMEELLDETLNLLLVGEGDLQHN